MRHTYLVMFITVILSISIMNFSPIYAGESPTLEELERDLYCMCGCVKILAFCEMSKCSVSVQMRSELAEMIERGLSKEEILDLMRKKYGDEVIATPPTTGFSLAVWLYPLIGGGIGLGVLYLLLRRREEVVWHGEPEELLERGEEVFEEYLDYEEKYDKLFEEEFEKFRKRKRDEEA